MTREEKIEYLAKAVMTLSELGDGKTAYVLNEIRLEMKSQLELPAELEEAAFTYENNLWESGFKDCGYSPQEVNDAFKAGAEWQKEKTAWVYLKEAKDAVIALEKEKGEPLNPRVAFVNGARWQKQQMLEEAVEGVARPDDCEIWVNLVGYGYKFKDGDKVKIIVVKEDER